LIVGVDPDGSLLAYPDSLNGKMHSYKVKEREREKEREK